MSEQAVPYTTHLTITHQITGESQLQEKLVRDGRVIHAFTVYAGEPSKTVEKARKFAGSRYLNGEVSIGYIDLAHLQEVRDAIRQEGSNPSVFE